MPGGPDTPMVAYQTTLYIACAQYIIRKKGEVVTRQQSHLILRYFFQWWWSSCSAENKTSLEWQPQGAELHFFGKARNQMNHESMALDLPRETLYCTL